MSLVCETIISEDELSQTQSHATNCDDEELDYEEEDIHKANNESINENSKVDHNLDNNSQQLEEDDDKDEGLY